MKLRVRILRQTSRVELSGEDPSLKDLSDLIRETLLSAHGLRSDSAFSLSLNGSELLSVAGTTLSSCDIVSGDLICVLLPNNDGTNPSKNKSSCSSNTPIYQSCSSSSASSSSSSSFTSCSSSSSFKSCSSSSDNQQSAAMTSIQPSVVPAAADPPMEFFPPRPCTWDPLLCSEASRGQVPLSLELLLVSAPPSCPADAVMVAAHLLMLETGFLPQDCAKGQMPAGWRSPSVYKLQYSHPLCENSRVMVLAVTMGPELVINATLKVGEKVDTVPKLCVKPDGFLTPQWRESAAAAFKDLSKLSRLFKDQISYPLIAAARAAMSLPVVFGLAALPPELLLRVLRLLNVQSVLSVSSTCKHLNICCQDASLWRHLVHRDHTVRDASRDTDWKEFYRKHYKQRRERLWRHNHPRLLPHPHPMHPHPHPMHPHPHPMHPPLPPGIIGGEYDQRPLLLLPPRPRYDPIHGPPPPSRPASRETQSRLVEAG
ncbi:F-box only protein 7 isoform X2 [Gymnodraco acuticeps]|uniref:F-box only protein 7 isoform X2 n=1 Tax=Gymnodraco acuticeps TaxID=8218 RepID=A0A6P8STX4_GYMAC|nr:F-box only protein 7 isoform X2 [Gymnodraco acuticeps]